MIHKSATSCIHATSKHNFILTKLIAIWFSVIMICSSVFVPVTAISADTGTLYDMTYNGEEINVRLKQLVDEYYQAVNTVLPEASVVVNDVQTVGIGTDVASETEGHLDSENSWDSGTTDINAPSTWGNNDTAGGLSDSNTDDIPDTLMDTASINVSAPVQDTWQNTQQAGDNTTYTDSWTTDSDNTGNSWTDTSGISNTTTENQNDIYSTPDESYSVPAGSPENTGAAVYGGDAQVSYTTDNSTITSSLPNSSE